MSDLNECMDKLGYRFREDGLLRRALTHSSLAVEQHRMGEDNERLEYLGDAVLEHLVSRHLYDTHPEMREGALTRLRSSLVCEEALAAAARRLGLGEYLLLSRGEEQCGGRKKDSILSDAFEAVLAAIYLDGGLAEAQKLVQDYVLCAEGQEKRSSSKDSKTAFQELVHADHKGRTIRYELVSESGPDHKKEFTMRVLVDDIEWGVGSGPSKQAAGQAAAQMAMERYTKACD
ncbi:MAG: ribonuclease III [Clostridia bacterium]|nr:ribonuclease III [Clostridia bacterium]MBR0422441.1 ribonuclease III [Clostridia bacterium]